MENGGVRVEKKWLFSSSQIPSLPEILKLQELIWNSNQTDVKQWEESEKEERGGVRMVGSRNKMENKWG